MSDLGKEFQASLDAQYNRDVSQPLLVAALHYLDNIPQLARTRADTVIAACIRYYLK